MIINSFQNLCHIFYLAIFTLIKLILYLIKIFFKGILEVIISIPKYFINGIRFIFTRKWKKEKFTKIIFALSISVYLVCVFLISRWIAQNTRLSNLAKDIRTSTEIVEKIEKDIILNDEYIDETNNIISNDRVSFNLTDINFIDTNLFELKEKNNDTVGWLQVLGTRIDYPIVQTDNNEYYLKHNFDKKSTYVGWVFGDYRNDMKNFKKNTIIYAHNLNSNQMFGTLPDTLKKDWYNNIDNHYVRITSFDSNTIWQVISVYTIKPESYYIRTIFSNDEFNEFLTTIKDRSVHDFNYIPNITDRIVTLSTCSENGLKRMVLHAKLVGIQYK